MKEGILICLIGYLLLLSALDLKWQSFPKWLLGIGFLLAAVQMGNCWFVQSEYRSLWFTEWVFGMMPGIVLLLTAFLTGKIGKGDGYLFILIGLAVGSQRVFFVFLVSLLMAFAYSAWMTAVRKVGKSYRFPYVPFITLAFCLVWVAEKAGERI